MLISGLTAANISTTVWTQATRSLTNVGYAALSQGTNQSLATGATFGLRPTSVGIVRYVTVSLTQPAGGAGNSVLRYNDGTNTFTVLTAVPGATLSLAFGLSTRNCWLEINNGNNTNAAIYAYGLLDITL
jgi:hypothetical protein